MKRFSLFVPILAGLLLSSLLVAQNQPTATKIGYLNARAVVEAHPQFARVKEIQTKAEAELKPLREQLQPLDAKIRAGNATAQEQQSYRALSQNLQDSVKKWNDQQNAALRPITEDIDKIVSKIAQEQGFAIVLDQEVAASSGLVVYAAQELDITQAVVRALPK
ncbi:OmpH family outer membrane protein [Meiothermus sp. CFH 77666]|uniref:OmpH family outer membrane protein n=1 Tax=Meiothermus sp. CFH 77666 TaxID=2817942 RepID=UPI001AA0844C|nr:OmpH family outer membrane protein [Meiothermus sp. CFH 77666]MBO1435852.1 OmpH family outer membrane protein [Meiothermus sp. CFH 77666]